MVSVVPLLNKPTQTLGIIAITWLVIADQSSDGIFDSDCIKLANLHSNAVDYPKSGQPVPLQEIPKRRGTQKPDWNAPETLRRENDAYYESVRAIGKLFRSIDLPAIGEAKREARRQRRGMAKGNTNSEGQLTALIEQLHNHDPLENDVVTVAIQGRVAEFISPDEYDDNIVKELWELYCSYVSELRTICADHTLSHERSAMLTEEEVVVSFRPISMNVTGHRR